MNVDFHEVIDFLKKAHNIRFDRFVADLLGLTVPALATRKQKNNLPEKELMLYCEKRGIEYPREFEKLVKHRNELPIEELQRMTQEIGKSTSSLGLDNLETRLIAAFRRVPIERRIELVFELSAKYWGGIVSTEESQEAAINERKFQSKTIEKIAKTICLLLFTSRSNPTKFRAYMASHGVEVDGKELWDETFAWQLNSKTSKDVEAIFEEVDKMHSESIPKI